MNDFPNQTTFSFGKVELGIVDDPPSTLPTAPPAPHQQADTITQALRQKTAAVDALDNLLYSPAHKLDRRSYQTIRDALESMAAILEPQPPRRAGSTKREPAQCGATADSKQNHTRSHKIHKKRRKRSCPKP